jgi:hypothetical protein
MTDEERLHMITEQLIIVRDNLFRGMSKSMQKLQARSINEVLGLENFTESPKPIWVGLTELEIAHALEKAKLPPIFSYRAAARAGIEAFKERNQ